jgi:hypothetical protein
LDQASVSPFSYRCLDPTLRPGQSSSRHRWYNDIELPASLGGGEITVRLHGNEHDKARGFNRTENVRPIPQGDPDFARLYARRNDAESINRALDDTFYLGRAHSMKSRRQAFAGGGRHNG